MGPALALAVGWRLPQLDAIPLGIGDPTESSFRGLFDTLVHLHALAAQVREDGIEIGDPVIGQPCCPHLLGVFASHTPQ